MATSDEIKESELGNKVKILGFCLRRSPSTDVWAADYGCLLVYETPDCSGEFHRQRANPALLPVFKRKPRSRMVCAGF